MTIDEAALLELLDKGADGDLRRAMRGGVAERLMALEVAGRCGAGHGERPPSRTNQRNGLGERSWETRADLEMPKLSKGAWLPGFLEPRRTAEKNEAAIIRLVGALLLEQNDEWAVGRRSMSLETLAPFGHGDHLGLPAVAA